jgi:hypothetical protein
MCFLPAYRALSALSRLRLHLQLLDNKHQLVLYLLASSETFWKLTECLAAGKGEMNCLGENERIQGLELVETVEKKSQPTSLFASTRCLFFILHHFPVSDKKKKQSFPNVSQVDRLLLGRLPGLRVQIEDG